mgnify:CR=1 FL=1
MNIDESAIPFLDWKKISKSGELDESFIIAYAKKIRWKLLLEHQQLSEELLVACSQKIDWYTFSKYQQLTRFSDSFIESYKDRIHWDEVSIHQPLTEEFIETYGEELNWFYLSQHQTLSEEFVERNAERLTWRALCPSKVEMSNAFILTHFDRLNPRLLTAYKHDLNEEVIDRILELDPFSNHEDAQAFYYVEQYQTITNEQRQKLNHYWREKHKKET